MPERRLTERLARVVARDPDGSRSVLLLAVGLVLGLMLGSLVIDKTQDSDLLVAGGARGEDGELLEDDLGAEGDGLLDGEEGTATGADGRASGSTRSAGGPGATGGGAGGTTGAAGVGGTGGPVRGVTDSKIRIGVALPDIEAFGNVSEDFDVGDQREQMEAVLDGWRQAGLVPVHGRDIEFVYEVFDILSPEEKIAACNRFIKDHRVFAVLAGRFFEDGAECVAERFDTPVVSVNSALEGFYERTAPFLFTIRSPWLKLFRNWVAWADVGGHFEGHRIGLFYESEVKPAVEAGIKQEMAARGYEITEEVEASGAGIGTSQDQAAVQRFRQEGVDLVMFVAGGTSAINFMTFAESQGYRPDYIDTDYGEHTTDAAAGAYPPEQYDGTYAMTATRVGEVAAGRGLPPETVDCVNDYENFSGKDIGPRSPETAEYNSVLISCDLANPMLRGIQAAGRQLNHGSLLAGLETIKGMALAVHGDLSYGPGRHWGVEQQRTAQWRADCGCWVAVTPQMGPYFL